MKIGSAVVIGGGVIGSACAYYLSRLGWAVTILDRGPFGMGCSHGNCGFVSPSHVLPLAAPGALWPALKALFTPNSPLSIKPRFDLGLWSWLIRFARRCNQHDMLESAHGIQALLTSSRTLYDELMATEPFDCEWQTRGVLFVLQTQHAMEHFAANDRLLRTGFGLAATRYDGDALVAFEPALKPGLAGGWHYSSDAHLRPDRLMAGWRRVLESRGVTIIENCEVTGFVAEHGRAKAVCISDPGRASGRKPDVHPSQGPAPTPRTEIAADAFVVAAGAWTPLLAKQLGGRIPIQPGKGYSITMPRPQRCPSVPLLFEEHRVAVTPMDSSYRLGSTMEFAGYDTRLVRSRLELLRAGARHYLHEPECEPLEEEWCGLRPMTYDGKPIIDRSPALANVLIAAGHGMLGVSMAPATGKLAAELLSDQEPHVAAEPYRLGRFG
jgi:D-amino-acid dehydrogenase